MEASPGATPSRSAPPRTTTAPKPDGIRCCGRAMTAIFTLRIRTTASCAANSSTLWKRTIIGTISAATPTGTVPMSPALPFRTGPSRNLTGFISPTPITPRTSPTPPGSSPPGPIMTETSQRAQRRYTRFRFRPVPASAARKRTGMSSSPWLRRLRLQNRRQLPCAFGHVFHPLRR